MRGPRLSAKYTSVVIQGLPLTATASGLRDFFFRGDDDVDSIEVSLSRTSPSYEAIVTFYSPRSVESALKHSYTVVAGRPIRVIPAQRRVRPDHAHFLVFTGLPPSCADSDLHGRVAAVCRDRAVILAHIDRTPGGESLGSALVELDQPVDPVLHAVENAFIGQGVSVRPIPDFNDPQNPLYRQLPPNVVSVAGSTDRALVRRAAAEFGEPFAVEFIGGHCITIFRGPVQPLAMPGIARPPLLLCSHIGRELYQVVMTVLERRTVFVSSLPWAVDLNCVSAHFALAGDVAHVEPNVRGRCASVQYRSDLSQQLAVARLDLLPCGGALPVRVCPFLDSRTAHPPAGLLQLNEVVPNVSLADLKQEFGRYGRVLASALSPCAIGEQTGFVLLENFAAARAAASGIRNALLFPPADPTHFLPVFTESDRVRCHCIAVRNPPAEWGRGGFEARCREAGSVTTIAGVFAYFEASDGAEKAYGRFVGEGLTVDLLNGNGLLAASRQLADGELSWEWQRAVLFLKGLPPVSNRVLYDKLSQFGPVRGVFQNVNALTGILAGTGIVVFAGPSEADFAMLAAENRGLVIAGTSINAMPFRNRTFAPPDVRKRTVFLPPNGNLTPRAWLRAFALANFGMDDAIVTKIENMSIDDCYQLVVYSPEVIIQTLTAGGDWKV
jgi:hypothetical protein